VILPLPFLALRDLPDFLPPDSLFLACQLALVTSDKPPAWAVPPKHTATEKTKDINKDECCINLLVKNN
jgi:hypothetical protein